jgi:hypothetical protein
VFLQVLVHEANRGCAVTHSGRDALDRALSNISGGDTPGTLVSSGNGSRGP